MRSILKKLVEQVSGRDAASPDAPLPEAATALLFEIAFADRTVEPAERAQIRRAIAAFFPESEATLDLLLADAEAGYEERVGVQSLTRALTEHWSEPERYALVVAMWRVALADETLDAFEEHRIRSIADLLYLSHQRFIEAKIEAKGSAAASS